MLSVTSQTFSHSDSFMHCSLIAPLWQDDGNNTLWCVMRHYFQTLEVSGEIIR